MMTEQYRPSDTREPGATTFFKDRFALWVRYADGTEAPFTTEELKRYDPARYAQLLVQED
jgi:hypothetical protein